MLKQLNMAGHVANILVAEEKSDWRDVVVYILQRCGYNVIEVDDEPDRIVEAMSTDPDVILLDTDLLGKRAEVVIAQLQKDSSSKRVPIICQATDANDWLTERFIKAGATEVLSKPYDLTDLPSILRKCLVYKDH
jgi:CheY-like chemotaxis protein